MKETNLRYMLCIAAVLLSLTACSGGGDKPAVAFPDSLVDDELIATVNGAPINGRDLRVFARVYEPAATDSVHNRMHNLRLLDGMIDRALLFAEANTMGVDVPDSLTSWFLERFVASIGGGLKLASMLTEAGIQESDLRSMVRRDLVIRRHIESNLAQGIVVSSDAARRFYDENPANFETPDSVRARHIILRASGTDGPSEKLAKHLELEQIKKKVDAGEDFAQLAKVHSQGPSAPSGGDLGYFARQDMVPAFSDVAFSLKPGETSDVVETQFGYHIIHVVDHKPARKLSFEEVEAALTQQLRARELSKKLDDHIARIRSAAVIEPNFDFGGLTQRESATFTR